MLPEGKGLILGVIAHTTAAVEHPGKVAERLMTFARVVGREWVIAGANCGFAQGALYQRQHPTIVWAKFAALVQGARFASACLWRSNAAGTTVATVSCRTSHTPASCGRPYEHTSTYYHPSVQPVAD
jgi:hypothetical protein